MRPALRPRGRGRAVAPALARSVVRTSTLRWAASRPDLECCNCALLAQRGVGPLRPLNRAGAGLHQAVVARLLFLGEFQIGFGGGDVGCALLDDGCCGDICASRLRTAAWTPRHPRGPGRARP